MEYFVRKLWYSIIVAILVLVTTVTSTYAWYASVFTNDIDEFNFDISGTGSIYASLDGVNFKSNFSDLEIKTAILTKRGIDTTEMKSSQIDELFKQITLYSISPNNYEDLSLGFYKIDEHQQLATDSGYLSLDMYFTTDLPLTYHANGDPIGQEIFFQSDSIIESDSFYANLSTYNLPRHPVFGDMNRKFYVNAKNACRVGVSRYETVTLGVTDNFVHYQNDEIYYFGDEEPSISSDGVYSFGNIKQENNVALQCYNSRLNTSLEVPNDNREDTNIIGNSFINSKMGLCVNKMMKVTFYIWLEGWDSDCFDEFQGKSLNIYLKFSSYPYN